MILGGARNRRTASTCGRSFSKTDISRVLEPDAGQILVGTDYPYMTPELPVDKTLRTLGLPPDAHADITWNNCFRFLGIKPPSLSQ